MHESLETSKLSLGFIPLVDCAPLAVAQEQGFFAAAGLEVELVREPSWANIRDKVVLGLLDGAHMPAGIPLATSLGIGGVKHPLITAFSLNLNGNAITVSRALHAELCALAPQAMQQRPLRADALRQLIAQRRAAGAPALTFAIVFPVSSHYYQLRYWLAASGIDPEHDLRIIVIPPPQMLKTLQEGRIDGFCVGEPWNSEAVRQGLGQVLISGYEWWNNSPEKVLGVSRAWAERHPHSHQALLQALLRACQWLEQQPQQTAEILARPEYVGLPVEHLLATLRGQFAYGPESAPEQQTDFLVFSRYAANFPWRSHALWLLQQMQRWGQLDAGRDLSAIARDVYRPDLFRQAAQAVGLPCPAQDYKAEGGHAAPWLLDTPQGPLLLGADRFFDGAQFEFNAAETV